MDHSEIDKFIEVYLNFHGRRPFLTGVAFGIKEEQHLMLLARHAELSKDDIDYANEALSKLGYSWRLVDADCWLRCNLDTVLEACDTYNRADLKDLFIAKAL